MEKKEFDEMIRGFYAKIHSENIPSKDDYNSSFTDGEKKGKEVLIFLNDVKADVEKLAYISIGGADGAEVFYVMENSSIRKAIVMEYDSEFCKIIRDKNHKGLELLEGDAWGHRNKCAEIIGKWLAEGTIKGIVITAFSVLHELPYRSDRNYQFIDFLATIVGPVNEAYFYCKEPSRIIEWQGRVKLNIPEWFSPQELYRFSKVLHTQFKGFFSQAGYNEIIQHADGVVLDAQLAGEVLRKILYFLNNKSVYRLIYELGECHAALDPLKLSKDLNMIFKKSGDYDSRVEKQMTISETLNSLYRQNTINITFWDAEVDREGWVPTGFVKMWAYFRPKRRTGYVEELKGNLFLPETVSNLSHAPKELFKAIDRQLKDDEFYAKKLAQYEKRAVCGELLENILIDILDDIDYLKSNTKSEHYGLLQQYVARLMIMTSVSDPAIHSGNIIPFHTSREFIDRSIKIISPKNQIESFWLSALTFRESNDLKSMQEYCELIISNSNSNLSKSKYRLYAARELAILQYNKGDSNLQITRTLSIIEEKLEDIIVSPEQYSYNNYETVEKVITMWAYFDLCLKTMNIDKAQKFYKLLNKKIMLRKLLNKLHKVMVSDFYRSLYLYHLLLNHTDEAKAYYAMHKKLCTDYNLQNSMQWIDRIKTKFDIYML